MSEKVEIPGLWWVPGKDKEKWVGTLISRPGKSPCLTLTVPQGFGFSPPTVGELLHGCNQHGKPITLLYPGQRNVSSTTAPTTLEYCAGFAIIGIELPSRDSFRVNTLTIDVQHFYEWAGVSGFFTPPQENCGAYVVGHRLPPVKSFVVNNDLTLQIVSSFHRQDGPKDRTIAENTLLEFKSQRGFDFAEWRDLVAAVRGFLHFGVLLPVYATQIVCSKDGHGHTLGQQFVPEEIEIYSAMNHDRVESEPRDRWVFHFSDIENRFAQFMTDWLAFYKEFDEALGCYFTTVYHSLPDEVKHVCLTQGLESFHATKHRSRGRLTFAVRIRELVEAVKPHLQDLVPDPEAFSKSVRDNRNFYTHHDPALAGRALAGAKLFQLNEKLMLLFQMCVLGEMGIPADRFIRLRRQLASRIVDYR